MLFNMKGCKMCESCEASIINGVYCHEQGCPDSWKTEIRECLWCGSEFKPEHRDQHCCCDDCHLAYYS